MNNLYCVIDTVSGESKPFVERNDRSAKRGFFEGVNGHPFKKDMILCFVGSFIQDEIDGQYVFNECFQVIAKGDEENVQMEDTV